MDIEAESRREMFARYGVAAYQAQCFEFELGNILSLQIRLDGKVNSLEELFTLDERISKKTLGGLLTEVRKFVNFDTKSEEILNEGLSKRNYLTHNYFSDNSIKILSLLGRDEMIIQLDNLSEAFKIAEALVQNLTKLLMQKLGITDEHVKTEYEKLLKLEYARNK
jgi:hypothetical protein